MNSFRVHSTEHRQESQAFYLSLEAAGAGRITLDFTGLEAVTGRPGPRMTLSEDAVYELFHGRSLDVPGAEGTVSLVPQDGELVIELGIPYERRTYRVSLSEAALGWNLLRGSVHSVGAR